MREILFKGKRKDNHEWTFGDLLIDDDLEQYCIVGHLYHSGEDEIERYEFCYEVDPETVGQYTGLTDKNGTKIFEGDIFTLGDVSILYVVEWQDTGLIGRQKSNSSSVGLEYWNDRIEVIGNIYDKEATK